MVGKQGLEPHPPAPKAGALTLTLHPVNPILFSSCRLFHGDGGAEWFGGDERNRTAGLLLARQPLSQLSYIPEAAPDRPVSAERLGTAIHSGLVRAYVIPTRVVRLVPGVHAVELSIGMHVHP